MNKFEQKEMNKINWLINWLINFIRKSIRKNVSGFKDKIVSLFKTNTPKQTVFGRGKKLSKPKTKTLEIFLYQKRKREDVKDRIIREIFLEKYFLKQKKKKRKNELEKKRN